MLKEESGDNDMEAPPVPIPNTEVKLHSADDTWWATARESRSLPDTYGKTAGIFISAVLALIISYKISESNRFIYAVDCIINSYYS